LLRLAQILESVSSLSETRYLYAAGFRIQIVLSENFPMPLLPLRDAVCLPEIRVDRVS
jgi:hypothetical protein